MQNKDYKNKKRVLVISGIFLIILIGLISFSFFNTGGVTGRVVSGGGEIEICDGLDNDGDGEIDEGCDDDQDGFADATMYCPYGESFYSWQYILDNPEYNLGDYISGNNWTYHEDNWWYYNGNGWLFRTYSCDTNSGDRDDTSPEIFPGSEEFGCGFQLFQDNNFSKGFAESMGYLEGEEACHFQVDGKNAVWQIQEIATNQYFCDNLPQPTSDVPFTLTSAGGEKELINYGKGHLRFKIDSSQEENHGCHLYVHPECLGKDESACKSDSNCRWNPENSEEYKCFDDTGHWWVHYGITTGLAGPNYGGLGSRTHLSYYDTLNFSMSMKVNEMQLKYTCRLNEIYPFYDNSNYAEPGTTWFAYIYLDNISEVNGPETISINLPPFFLFNGTYKERETFISQDTFGTPGFKPSTNENKMESLKNGDWVNYSFDLKPYIQNALNFYNQQNEKGHNINPEDYAFTTFTFATEPYGGGFYEDIEIKDLSLIGGSSISSLCNFMQDNPKSSYYSSGYSKQFDETGWRDVNGEFWYVSGDNSGKPNGWVRRPFFYDCKGPLCEGGGSFENCNTFTYSPWTECNSSGKKTRTVTEKFPEGCEGGKPNITTSCKPPCTINNWQSIETNCFDNGTKVKNWTMIGNCNESLGISKPTKEILNCNPDIVKCINFSYSNWSDCLVSGIKTRNISSQFPESCEGGNSNTTITCNYVSQTSNQNTGNSGSSSSSQTSSLPGGLVDSRYSPGSSSWNESEENTSNIKSLGVAGDSSEAKQSKTIQIIKFILIITLIILLAIIIIIYLKYLKGKN